MSHYLIVYKCVDDGEEEACFLLPDLHAAAQYLASRPAPPEGFEARPGYYFYETHGGPTEDPASVRGLLRAHQVATDTNDSEMLDVVCAHLDQLFGVDDIIAREFWEHVTASSERVPGDVG